MSRAAQTVLAVPALAALLSISMTSHAPTAQAAPASPGPGPGLAPPLAAPTSTLAPASADASPPARRPRKIIVEPPPPIPDPAALRVAQESNYRSEAPRAGIAAGIFFMGWQQIGSVDDAGRGGGVGLRLGATATPETVVWLELVAGAFPDNTKADCTMASNPERCLSFIESSSALAVSAQHYLGPTFWLRGGGGFGTYTKVRKMGLDRVETREADGGLAAIAGAGLDVVRRHRTRLSLETMLSLQRFSSGWIFDVGFGFGVALY